MSSTDVERTGCFGTKEDVVLFPIFGLCCVVPHPFRPAECKQAPEAALKLKKKIKIN